jgi:elongation factor G
MQNVQVDHTRNFAIIGHSGDGKTSLGEAILHRAGATTELGRVDDGTSVLNYLPEERTGHHTASITSHVYAFNWNDNHVTLVDTPGDPNFQGDGEVALQALDAAILVVDAVDGVKSGTQRMLNAAEQLGLPLLVFVNGLDRERADLESAVASLEELEQKPVQIAMPIGSNADLAGVIDVVHMKAIGANGKEGAIPDDLLEDATTLHELLMEAVAECDDELLEKYLDEGELGQEEICRGLSAGIRALQILPVLCGSATAEVGVDMILHEIEELLPSAEDRGAWKASALRRRRRRGEAEPSRALLRGRLQDHHRSLRRHALGHARGLGQAHPRLGPAQRL